jgi:phospholipid transport system transporter-binding protein
MRLPARLTMAEAGAALAALESAPASDAALRVDASALADFDSAALALLLHARRLAARRGQTFELAGAPLQLVQLAQLYGVAALLQLDAAGAARQAGDA